MADGSALRGLDAARFVDAKFGLPTVRDILAELEKPGRDPRPSFKTATFAEGVNDIKDLKPGCFRLSSRPRHCWCNIWPIHPPWAIPA